MGNRGLRAGLPSTKTVPSRPPEDRLLFILVYVKTYALQVVQGRLFGMVQGKANQWIHILLPTLLAALRANPATTSFTPVRHSPDGIFARQNCLLRGALQGAKCSHVLHHVVV